MPAPSIPHRVTVLEVAGAKATVQDHSTGGIKSARVDLRRTGDYPRAGEEWIIDLAYGQWSFAARVTADTPGNTAGIIAQYAGDTGAPAGWLPCDGRMLDLPDYPELWTVIGNKYGESGGFKVVPIAPASGYGDNGALTIAGAEVGDVLVIFLCAVGNLPRYEVTSMVNVYYSGNALRWRSDVSSPRNGVSLSCYTGTVGSASINGTDVGWTTIDPVTFNPATIYFGVQGFLLRNFTDATLTHTVIDSSTTGRRDAFSTPVATEVNTAVLGVVATTEDPGVTFPSGWTSLTEGACGVAARRATMYPAEFVQENPEPLTVRGSIGDDSNAWVAGFVSIQGEQRTFPIPDIADGVLGGEAARYIISTGLPWTSANQVP